MQHTYMGHDYAQSPSVEVCGTGKAWIKSGLVMARVNFVA